MAFAQRLGDLRYELGLAEEHGADSDPVVQAARELLGAAADVDAADERASREATQ